MNKNQFKCTFCGGIFNYIRNETWSQEKADEEYKQQFPGESMENRDVICEECWQIVRPDRIIIPNRG